MSDPEPPITFDYPSKRTTKRCSLCLDPIAGGKRVYTSTAIASAIKDRWKGAPPWGCQSCAEDLYSIPSGELF